MEELFTGAGYYEGGVTAGEWLSMHWLTIWVVLLTLFVVLVFAGAIPVNVKKNGFTQREGLYAGINSVRDDTGFPSNEPLGDIAKRENLVESGRYPNLYTPSAVDLSTALALQNNVAKAAATGAAAAAPAAAPRVAPPAAAASAFRNKFTERMTPEEELQMRQAALGAVATSG